MYMLSAKGIAGQVEADESFVTITRNGVRAKINYAEKGDKRIPISRISAVQFKSAGFTDGYIQFTMAGSSENRSGLFAGRNDENTVQFKSKHQDDFDAIREHVEHEIVRLTSPAGSSAPESAADEIRKLSQLVAEGLLTDEEFRSQKARLLGV